MSYNSDLQNINTSLQSILDTVNALPDAGSGGGGNIETCTVEIISQSGSAFAYGCNVINADGEKESIGEDFNTDFVTSIENVECNSIFGMLCTNVDFLGYTTTNATMVASRGGSAIFRIDAPSGETATIVLEIDI